MVNLRKVILILSASLMIFSSVQATDLTSSDHTVTYGNSITIGYDGASVGNTEQELDLCGGTVTSMSGKTSTSGSFTFNVPDANVPCTTGTHNLELNGADAGTLTVNPKGMSDPNKGDYLFVDIDVSDSQFLGENIDPDKHNALMLTNDPWESDVHPHSNNNPAIPDGAYVLAVYFEDNNVVEEHARGVYQGQYGEVLDLSDGSLASIVEKSDKWNNPDGSWIKGFTGPTTANPPKEFLWDKTINANFGSTNNFFYFGGCRSELIRVGDTQHDFSSCAPIHENGAYEPQGEIIAATDMSRAKDNFYSDSSNSNMVSKSKTNFYVCRGDYRGTDIDSSELVKVQQGDPPNAQWEYYRCNLENEWVQDTCPPGQELVVSGTEAECEPIDEVNIRATYFNVSNVSFNAPSKGYTTGFKLNRSELDKYIAATGVPATVDAECWMGEDNERPSNPDGSVTFTAKDSGSGDLWMLEKVPGRSSAENSTYSCIWGLRNTQADSDENIYDTANNDPINSRDGGRIDIKFDDIQSQAASSSTSEIGRWVWDFYEKPEDGGFDYRSVVNNQYHFMFDNEFPYCEGTSFWSSVGPSDRNFQAGTPEQLRNINCSGGTGGGSSSYPDYADTPDAVTSGPTEVEVGNSIQFDGSGSSDTDGTIESYSWEVRDGSGNTVAGGSGSNFRFTPGTSGTYTLELNVTDNYGAIGTTTDTFEVKDNVNTEDEFTVAYVPAHIEDSETGMYSSLVDSAHQKLRSNLKMDTSKLSKYKVDKNTCHVTSCEGKADCRDKAVDKCVDNGPLESDDYDIIHLICDNEDSYGGESNPCGDVSQGGLAKMGAAKSMSVYNGDETVFGEPRDFVGLDFPSVVVHEIGHNLNLEHLFNSEMLNAFHSIGDKADSRYAATVARCYAIPRQYAEEDGGGIIIKEKHEEERGGDPVSSTWKNLEDNDKGEDAFNYFMSYCGEKERFGPEAENYMENGKLSGYQ